MKKVIKFFCFVLIVFLVNNIGIFFYGYAIIDESTVSMDSGALSDVLMNGNEYINYSDYTLRNWSDEPSEKQLSDNIMSALMEVECVKKGRFISNAVRYMQSKNNSILEIKINSLDSEKITYPIARDTISKLKGSSFSCDVVNLFNKHFLIVRFLDELDPAPVFATSVYEVRLEHDEIDLIGSIKPDKELYSRAYPVSFAYYYDSPKLLLLSSALKVIIAFGLFAISERKKKKGNMR